MKKNQQVSILDVTLRDGSYAINYQFTLAQASCLASALYGAGIEYIEAGHGCGLGAGKNLGYKAAAGDCDYVKAVRKAAPGAKIGVIAGPPPTTHPQDIDTIIDKVDFIRFAANCDNPGLVEANIAYARQKRPDLPIFFQMMRSTRLSPQKLLESARQVVAMGVSVIYLVDTAGHFIPEEVSERIALLTSEIETMIGFHGHNNLSMAVANSIAAVEAGAAFVDASLKGLGRAAGNAVLEALVSILLRKGIIDSIDFDALVKAGKEIIAPLMAPGRGIYDIDLVTADANIDLYPERIYRQTADLAGLEYTEFIRMLAADERLVEAGQEEINRVLLRNISRLTTQKVNLSKKVTAPMKPALRKKTVILALKSTIAGLECPGELIEKLSADFAGLSFQHVHYNPQRIEYLDQAEVLFAPAITPLLLAGAAKLQWFHSLLIGTDHFLSPGIKKRNIYLTTPRGAYSVPMAETALGLMLALTRKLHQAARIQEERQWGNLDIINSHPAAGELAGAAVAILGLGGTGMELARRCSAMGMKVIGVVQSAREKPACIESLCLDLDEALMKADFLVLTCPLTEKTRGIINKQRLSLMKKEAYLVNISRGALVDENALLEALSAGSIGGAALDSFVEEPLPAFHPFYSLPNVIISPHIAGWSSSFWKRAIEHFKLNLQNYLKGEPLLGLVDLQKGY